MGRSILAVLAGIILGAVMVYVVQLAGHQIFPPPEGMDPSNPESIKQYMSQIPTLALVWILLSYALGSLAGGGVAAAIAPKAHLTHALIVGGVQTCFGIANYLMITHPLWMMVVGTPIFLVFAFLGGKLARPKVVSA